MKSILAALLLLLSIDSLAQYRLEGKVLDDKTQKPLEGVAVFLSNTTIGAITNNKGEFQLNNLKPGKYELVVTSLNYENYIEPVQTTQTTALLIVYMKPSVNILEEVVVEPYDKDGWGKWGNIFTAYLIGSASLSKNCILKNPEVVKFKYSKNANKLKAFSNEKLILENRDLGYRILYVLSQFEFYFNSSTLSYEGHPLFEELKPGNSKEAARWNQMRSNTYKGSLRHFIKSLYFNQLEKDGFEVKKEKWITQEEKRRVKSVLKQLHEEDKKGTASSLKANKDSMDYYISVKRLNDNEGKVLLDHLVSRDSILVSNANDPHSKTLYFNDYLQVIFLNKKPPYEFAKTIPWYKNARYIKSEINLRFNHPVVIYPNGNYYNGLDLFIDGYWVWSEKISTMLPSDYTPGNL